MDKRYKKSVLDLDIVLNDLDEKLQVASDDIHLTTMKKKECQLLSHIRKRITSTIEAVEETRQKRTYILRAKRSINESRTELSELQQKNIRLSEKLGNEKNEKKYRKKLLNDWITSFETLMVASRYGFIWLPSQDRVNPGIQHGKSGTDMFTQLIAGTDMFTQLIAGTDMFTQPIAETDMFTQLIAGTDMFTQLIAGTDMFTQLIAGTRRRFLTKVFRQKQLTFFCLKTNYGIQLAIYPR
ncbi:hypothetical protein KP79_PYT00802 [Mizuhopecten yessoensis]|uniref:Uncharacterized protein n=1 Tax=Mizuhopecten yessoensis TaxID=6573 RepID=A0A210QQA6_MIZYE|nr:hypothetical protein KP79_PYT00802 [Mizuhopecten yessoensis]